MTLDTDTGRELERANARVRELEQRVTELGRRLLAADSQLARMAQQEIELREAALTGVELEGAQRRIETLESEQEHLIAERDEVQATLERARRVHADMVASPSWRLTKPLRWVKSIFRHGN